jgi:hypothetical protein
MPSPVAGPGCPVLTFSHDGTGATGVDRVAGRGRRAARLALSEGRRALTWKLARKPDGSRPTPTLRVVPGDRVRAADASEDAPTAA